MKRTRTFLKWTSVVLLLLTTQLVVANGVLKGRIIDENNIALPAASVVVLEAENLVSIADNEGYFTISQIANGTHNIEISYIGFATQVVTVDIEEGKTTELEVVMKTDDVMLQGFVFKGRISDRSKALSMQKESIKISNVVSSDQVDRFPDANIGDALKRLPSINVQYDQGEARFVNIRGTSAEYSAVTINGSKIASAEGETRAAQFDLIPADMIKTIEVDKVITPDMDGDAIGGAVNLVTRGNPTEQDLFISLGTGYNSISGKPALKGSAIYSNRALDNKLGYTFSVSVQDNKLGSDNFESEWGIDEDDVDGDNNDEDLFTKEFQARQYYVERLRQSYSASFDYKFNADNKLEFKAIYNNRKDWENRYRTTTEYDEGEWVIVKEVKAGTEDNKYGRLEHQQLYNLSMNGEHQIGNSELSWMVAAKGASEDRPNERYLAYKGEVDNADMTSDFSDTRRPLVYATDATLNQQISSFSSSFYELDELTEEEQNTQEQNYSGRIDYKLPLVTGAYSNSLKVGAKLSSKSKNRENDFYEYKPLDEAAFDSKIYASTEDQTRDGFMAGDYEVGHFLSREVLGDLDLQDASQFEKEKKLDELAVNYDASESVTAAYLRFDQKIGEKIDLLAGLRVEHTKNVYSGFIYEEDKDNDTETLSPTGEKEDDYTNVLPSFIARYRPVNNFNLKAAFTQTIARPRYFDLVPFQEIKRDGSDKELSIGNPNLVATSSSNVDLMLEYFLSNIGVVSGGVFYKDISDIIITQTQNDKIVNDELWDKVEQSVNGGDATLMGFELAYQQQMTFLPGILKQVSVYANYTYNHSEINNFKIEDREGETLSMPGTPQHTMNASLMYDNEKISAGLSYNMASSFLDELGGEAFEDRYYDKVAYLDFNMDWKFYQGFTLSASVNNILNQPLRYYQGDEAYTMQEEYYGPTVNMGVKYRF